ncbi:MAG: MsnO8 family LLM class oxidoreductase, partial [Abiotrophia defectiva]
MLLSVLDYAMVDSGRTSQEALRETVALAQLADELGYHRFWVAEHHQVPALASASPELMIMHLLGKTQRIMIGSGGIMLPHYQPYKVAEWVTTLRSLYPGRV